MYYNSIKEFCKEWGYGSYLQGINTLYKYFNMIMETGYEIYEGHLIIKDEIYNQLGDKAKELILCRRHNKNYHKLVKESNKEELYRKIQEEKEEQMRKEEERRLKRQQEKEEEEKKAKIGGIYGIYLDDELIYIGMTERNFEKRWKEHMSYFEKKAEPPENMILYKITEDPSRIKFKVLVDRSNIKSERLISKYDLKTMELALITEHQPRCNYMGRVKDYSWKRERR